MRGLKTLGIRVERAQANAQKIARWLEAHPEGGVGPLHRARIAPAARTGARSRWAASGSMISFELKGGLDAGRVLMDNVHLATLAVSLGGVETLIEHPASMTHAGMAHEDRLEAGISDGLVRYSVGIEDVDDLIADLKQALAKV